MVFVCLSEREPLLRLCSPVVSQGCQTPCWKRNGTPGTLGFWLLKDQLSTAYLVVLHPHKCLPYVHRIGKFIFRLPELTVV